MKLLTKGEFSQTMKGNVTNVTGSPASMGMWPQVEELVKEGIVDANTFNTKKIVVVYRNGSETYEHILLPTNIADHFIVIVADIVENNIYGYYQLDLTEEHAHY